MIVPDNVIPLSLSAEQTLVGLLMSDSAGLTVARSVVGPGHLEDPACRLIYQSIIDCDEAGERVDVITVSERLERNGSLAEAGGFPGVVKLAQDAIGAVETCAGVIRRAADRARIMRLGERLQDAASRPGMDPVDLARLAVDHLQRYELSQKSGIEILDAATLKARHKAIAWAVKGVIPQNCLGMFFGASGTFKSFLALDYALHRCYGMPWLGRKTKKGVPVYIAAEGGAGIWRRIEAWHRLRHMDPDAMPMRVVTSCLSLKTQASELRDALNLLRMRPSDIIIDTLSQTFAGEENSSSEVADYLRMVGNELREAFAATVIIVHHVGHVATERPRGSSALIGNVDFLFSVYRDEKEMLTTFENTKQKDGDNYPPVTFGLHRVVLETDEDGDEISSLVARHISGAQEIIAAASKGGRPSSLVRLLQAIGTGAPDQEVRQRFYSLMDDADSEAKKKAWQRALNRAESQGLVTRRGDWLDVVQGTENVAKLTGQAGT